MIVKLCQSLHMIFKSTMQDKTLIYKHYQCISNQIYRTSRVGYGLEIIFEVWKGKWLGKYKNELV